MKTKGRSLVGFILASMILTLTLSLTLFGSLGFSAIPQKINYQGYLTSASGVPVNGTVQMVFSIYDVSTGGSALWTEPQSVDVTNGVYNVDLGSVTPIVLSFDVPYYLGVTVGADPEMVPRIALSGVGYAFRALTADTVVGSGSFTSPIVSTVSTGTAPLQVNSTTAVTNLNADLLDGQHALDFALFGHNHDASYVNVTGGNMSGSTSGAVLSVTNSGTGYGVTGTASGTNGRGVYGYASNTGNVTNSGGYFLASGTYGRGVYSSATGTSGYGVYGYATNPSAVSNYGGYFVADGTRGTGVYGVANNTADETNYGGNFSASGTSGTGVYGLASGTSGTGVHGYANNSGDVTNYGGYFEANGASGIGVHSVASGITGNGVYSHASGALGYGVVGVASGTEGWGVAGYASNSGDVTNYGGYFRASGTYGRGVYSSASGTSGYGVYGHATGASGIGVYGDGGLWDFYAANNKYGPFTAGHEVKLSEDFPGDIKPGMIVSVTGQTRIRRKENGTPSLSSTLPTIKLSSRAADKAVFGVFVAEVPLPKDHWYQPKEGERFATVNALGDGRVWVSNINGDIEAGDYITTSSIAGYGQRQDDDALHSYTLGKATETVDWDSVTETVTLNGKTYKVYLIAVVYTSG